MGHGVWQESGRPSSRVTASAALRGSDDTRVVRGDKITVKKDGVRVRILAEYVSKDTVEGCVLRSTKRWRKGAYVSVSRSQVVTEGRSPRITSAMSSLEEAELANA